MSLNLKILKCEDKIHCKSCRTDKEWRHRVLGVDYFDCPYGITEDNFHEKSISQPGTNLSKMLSKLGIKYTTECDCANHAKTMNDLGPQWCKENEDVIVSWMEDEAKKRNLPFSKFLAKKLLRKAIKKSEG